MKGFLLVLSFNISFFILLISSSDCFQQLEMKYCECLSNVLGPNLEVFDLVNLII